MCSLLFGWRIEMKTVWLLKGFHNAIFGIYSSERKAELAKQKFEEEHPDEWFRIEEEDVDA
jgi:hypothetical protein